MKKYIYIILFIVSFLLLGYTVYYILTHLQKPDLPIVAISVQESATTTLPILEDTNTHTTSTGKKIKLIETNPVAENLSTITITPKGFATNTPIVLETNKLTNALYVDLNNDTYEELVITTTAQGSGSFGEVFVFTTASNTELLPVIVPEVTEEDTKKGGVFEGYMGHDSFETKNSNLVREFPTYKKTDILSEPTGPTKSIIYTLTEKNGRYSFILKQGTTTPYDSSTNTATTTTISSSLKK